MNTTFSITGKDHTYEALEGAYSGIMKAGIALIMACTDGLLIILKDQNVVELDSSNAHAMAINLFRNGYVGQAEDITQVLMLGKEAAAMAAPQYDAALPDPQSRWTAEMKVVDTDGQKYTTTVQFEEVHDLQDIIEKGPTYGPGYTADIRLSYALT